MEGGGGRRQKARDEKGGEGRGIQNAVISERVKKCGRIKAPFAPGGPDSATRLRTFSVASREGATRGPRGGGGPRRNWFCIFMKALLPTKRSGDPCLNSPPLLDCRIRFCVIDVELENR